MAESKIPKEAVLYIFRPEVNITCGKCVFVKKSQCAVFGPSESISPERGSCGFYIHGDLGEAKEMPWIGFITKVEAGYAENTNGFQCKRCEYFDSPKLDCEKVDKDSDGDTPGVIHPNGCCNRWEADDTRGQMSANQLMDKLLPNRSSYFASRTK